MYYDYEQTDLILATHDVQEALACKEEEDGVLRVWENGESVWIFFDREDNQWKTAVKEHALDDNERELFKKFLELNGY
jgi:hypothetical protein